MAFSIRLEGPLEPAIFLLSLFSRREFENAFTATVPIPAMTANPMKQMVSMEFLLCYFVYRTGHNRLAQATRCTAPELAAVPEFPEAGDI